MLMQIIVCCSIFVEKLYDKKMKKIFLILLLLIPAVMFIQAQEKVAVYVTGDVENGYKKVIGSKLVTGITRSEQYAAVERTSDFLVELVKEQDYQMSGAVSDSQIARLGQQFGVRFVLVADISEIFESMFISARLIDVQTAQIVKSTENSGSVGDMTSLQKLAEDIVWEILKTKEDPDAVKVLNIMDFDDFAKISCMEGYHFATYDEVAKMIENNQRSDRKLRFPIYLNFLYTELPQERYYTCYTKVVGIQEIWDVRGVTASFKKTLSCSVISVDGTLKRLDLEYIDDDLYEQHYKSWNRTDNNGTKHWTKGFYYIGTPKPKIEQGYVYLIKDESNDNK